MKEEDYHNMLELLIAATKSKKLVWTEETGASCYKYNTTVGGCDICVWSDYDITIEDSSFFLTLSNPDGRVFSTYSYNESTDKDEYSRLEKLFNVIQDNIYRISESEKLIIDGLHSLVEQDDEKLPF